MKEAIKYLTDKYGTAIFSWIAVLLFASCTMAYLSHTDRITFIPPEDAYAAGTSGDVPVFVMEEGEGTSSPLAAQAGTVVRGSSVLRYSDTVEADGVTYVRIETENGAAGLTLSTDEEPDGDSSDDADQETAAGDSAEGAAIGETIENAALEAAGAADEDAQELYMRADNLAAAYADVVQETGMYVRTPVTIYAEESGPAIASFAAKGTCLKITGFDSLKDDGSVNRYRVAYIEGEKGAEAVPAEAEGGGAAAGADSGGVSDGENAENGAANETELREGYVYAKYMVKTQEEADAVYNENGIYDKAAGDKYGMKLYGGEASDLDYYPYEKPVIEGNEFCRYARTMYLNCAAGADPQPWIDIISETDCNAVVVDIKDGVLAYQSEAAKELSPKSYKNAYTTVEKYKSGIDALKETGVYTIGRIVVFNDPLYAKDHPENCIKYHGDTSWPSAFSRGVWEYNVRLAQEAVREFGFDEIQFDYVRFPETSYDMSKAKKTKWRNKYGEEKGQAVQNFCFYAADQIHEAGAYFSIDVFGESAYGYMTAYGQYWMGLSNIVDAISAMPYTDHMGVEGAWEDPYGTVKSWAKKAAKQQKKLANPAAARTWITGYDTPYWDPVVNYGKKRLKAQVKALNEQGLDGGFIPWNSASSLEKYYQYRKVWNE